MKHAGFGLIAGALLSSALLTPGNAAEAAPIVVEMFTSKYCPNCPSAELKMKNVAATERDLLIVFEHVDYWDSGDRKDPLGLADVTQRQYDYSGAMGRRPGEVFTPMPLLDGQFLAMPPLFFNWNDTLAKARAAAPKASLSVTKTADGGLEAPLPAGIDGKGLELWVIGIDKVSGSAVWNARGVAQGQISGGKARIAAALLPKGDAKLMLVQKNGPGAVVAVGETGVRD
jgi:hypothetical protein